MKVQGEFYGHGREKQQGMQAVNPPSFLDQGGRKEIEKDMPSVLKQTVELQKTAEQSFRE